jgi:hypothetical protein
MDIIKKGANLPHVNGLVGITGQVNRLLVDLSTATSLAGLCGLSDILTTFKPTLGGSTYCMSLPLQRRERREGERETLIPY